MNNLTGTSPASIFDGYVPQGPVCDEMLAADGSVRPHWNSFVDSLLEIGASELSRRWEQANRLMRENGMTYNAHGQTGDATRPWKLDALPLLFSSDEWRTLEAGLVQRAQLLDRIVADIYGPQRLLTSGLLPADLVFSHPGFLRALHQQRAPECVIHVCAFDLARAPDGRWWVIADRTDAPLGMGYALENRIIMSRMLPKIIRQLNVERVASFFLTLRDTLKRLAPEHRENPRIVLLTEGPDNPNYFEDSYLARYLGYTLVEGGDLAVRDDHVCLKTLGGLLPVDVIFRRLSDQSCDPLELRGDASLGVAGLLEVVRAGNVAVANGLGSSLVESAAFIPYLPGLCRHLLGEKLKLPSVATWWCGTVGEKETVLKRLGELHIRSAYRLDRQDRVLAARSSAQSSDDLADIITSQPTSYVAQENISRSSAPVWAGKKTEPMHVGLRVFLIKTKDSYSAMPGGLVRVSPASQQLDESILAGEGSKDVWVLADGPVHDVSLLAPTGRTIELRRSGAELPSRVADNLFWLGRFIERAEGAARLLRPILVRLTSEAKAESLAELSPLLHCLAEQGQIEPGFVIEGIREQLPSIDGMLPQAVLGDSQNDSLRKTVVAMHRNASRLRDRISLDCWRIIHRIETQLAEMANRSAIELTDLLELLNSMVIDLAAVDGLVVESMTRTQAFRFLDLGRRMERSVHTIALVRSALATADRDRGTKLESVLEVADSIMTYRARYLANLQMPAVLDLLLTDESNPRSLAYQLAVIADHVDNLPRKLTQPLLGPEQRIAMSALNSIRMVDNEALCEKQTPGKQTSIEQLLLCLSAQLPKLTDLISHKYLIHAGVPRQLAEQKK